MPRTMQEDSEGAFRAVIHKTVVCDDGCVHEYKLHYGPYALPSTAKTTLSRELKWINKYKHQSTTVEGWIEQTTSNWVKVDV